MVLLSMVASGCALVGRKRLNYEGLTAADRIEVTTTEGTPVSRIVNQEQIRYAVGFIQDRSDRWGDRISPFIPTYQLQFYRGDRYVGGYGVREKMLVAMPPSEGWWWRDVSEAEVAGLLKALGLEPIR